MFELQVPTITQDDLQQFHARTVGSSASPPSEYGNQAHSMGAGLEDDGLGYYPDGSKRTLSDEQVAIFRHTEIQSLLRARRLEQENQESDGSERSPTKKPEHGRQQPQSEPRRDEQLLDGDQDQEETAVEEEEYLRFLEAEREEFASAASARRNRGRPGFDPDHRKISTRRKVRELDLMPQDDRMLDYDEEAVSNFDSAPSGGLDTSTTGTIGKFHWPIIEMLPPSRPQEQVSMGV